MRSAVEAGATIRRALMDDDRTTDPGGELVRHFERLTGCDGRWHVAQAVRLRGVLDPGRLRAAFERVWAAHRARSSVHQHGDAKHERPDFRVIEVIDHPLSAVTERAGSDAALPFHAATPIRARLYRIDSGDHVFALAAHAASAGDAWLERFIGDLTAAYAGQPVPDRQASRRPDPVTGPESAEHWRWTLAEVPASLSWPRERRPVERPGRYEAASIEIDGDTAARIARLAERTGTAVDAVLRAALRVSLARHTGRYDLPLGVTHRTGDTVAHSALGDLLVVRSRLAARATFVEAVAAEHAELRSAAEHAPTGYAAIVNAARPTWNTGGLPLAQVRFDYRPSEPDWPIPGGDAVRLAPACFPFDMTATVTGTGRGYRIDLVCDAELFDPEEPASLIERLAVLLADAAETPTRPVGDLKVLTETDRSRLAASVRTAETDDAADQTLVELVRRQVERTPDAVAVRFEDQTRSYTDLRDVADRVAARLLDAGLGAEAPVAVMMERSADLPAVLLGVAKAGCASVPLDATHPADRIGYVLADAGVRALITEAEPQVPLPDGTAVLRTGELLDPAAGPRAAVGAPDPHPDALAYLLYTSGSTGRPKGVALTHRGLANCLRATVDLMDCGPGQRLLAVTTVSFDIAALELFCMLVSGGETIVATSDQARDGQLLRKALDRWRPDIMQATPMTWNMLLYCGWEGDDNLIVSCGGDLVSPALAARLRSVVKGFWHTYGPTETSLYTVCEEIGPGPQPSPLPIGTCISGNWVRILDERSRPVPPGVVGELCVGGAGVARGYVGPSGRTADRFIPDPELPDRRLYRTGDLARMLPDGRLELHGRNDRQVKVRGQRVEPGEIEAALARHPEVDAAAAVITGTGADQRIIAYLRPTDLATARQTVKEVADYARQRLPVYMVPTAFAAVDRMPTSPNGKIDRRALEHIVPPESDRPRADAEDGIAETVARLWSREIGPPAPDGAELSFSGEDLRRAAAFCDSVERECGVDVPISTLYRTRSLAGYVDQVRLARIAAADDTDRLPLDQLRHGGRRAPVVLFTDDGHDALLAALEPDRPVLRVPRPTLHADDRRTLVRQLAMTVATLPYPVKPILVGSGAAGGLALEVAGHLQEAAGLRVPIVLVATDAGAGGPAGDTGGPVTCVTPAAEAHLAEGWRRLGSRFELVALPGDRRSLLDGADAPRLAGIVSSLA